MTAPPGHAPALEAAPEHIGRAGTLPRQIRDEVARRFMAEFGMTGATAVRFAKALLADIKDERDAERMAHMSRSDLVRLMEELPLGLRRPRKMTPRPWAVRS